MHAGFFWGTDARNQKGHFDGCSNGLLGNGRATYIPDMQATPLTFRNAL